PTLEPRRTCEPRPGTAPRRRQRHTPPGKSPPPAQPPRVPGTRQGHTPGCGRTGPPHHRHRVKEEGERTRVRPRAPPPVRHSVLPPTGGDDDGAAGDHRNAATPPRWRATPAAPSR